MEEGDVIPEYKRNNKLDYLHVLKSLNEIPFSVGKNLLCDFLIGDYKNKSVIKHDLGELHNFSSLDFLPREEVMAMIENLIMNRLIDVSSSQFNKFMKTLFISEKGKQELLSPTLLSKKLSEKVENFETAKITDEEEILFDELSSFLENYNQEQKKAIVSNKETILCIAGAGSGKTTVLTKRIEYLNKFRDASPDKILAITFTRKAREEMQKRLNALGAIASVETFNSFCEKILKKNSKKIYERQTKIAGYNDKIFAMVSALESLGMTMEQAINKYFNQNQKKNKTAKELQNIFLNDVFAVLDYFKLKGFEDFTTDLKGKDYDNAKMVHNIVKYLSEYFEIQGLRTYADQMTDAITFLEQNKNEIPKFSHILVDEYQDINLQQIKLIDLLKPKNLFCVGDPRQAIFGWRGSDVNYILEFKKKYGEVEMINLKKNYRSNKNIVEFMNKSISCMKMVDLESDFKENNDIYLLEFDNEELEYKFILGSVMNLDVPREEIFVLARTNRQLIEISRLMNAKGISHIQKTDNFNSDLGVQKGKITLSTIHSIKGLEAKAVFVVGCNGFNFPCKTSEHPVMEIVKMYDYDKEEEERRLFYVAISRAKNKLYLTYTKTPTYFINHEMKKMVKG